MKTIQKLSMLLLATFVLWSCSNDDDGSTPINPPTASLNIVETAQATADLSILVEAVIQANLTATLSATGPYTVLAPTNAAFEEFLDSNPAWNSLADIDDETLTQVLLNHVIYGTVTSSTLISAGSGYTSTLADGAGGQNLSIYYNTSSGVKFNDLATVTTADVSASNGIVHIVDKVITLPSIVDHAIANPSLSSLVAAVTEKRPSGCIFSSYRSNRNKSPHGFSTCR
ncbi:fasciclin domain-containing protein [Lacinutrix neustonica]|uniref:Fasciclin domain-containing protein n=1 Tax=Lacinutrix neustonica TaxID=2980107 RepID=A0A9E8MZV2_9FLAO|nr:fasciclin domain-containing protein [Lacinutrix neustonica]WAC03537.1 fasciclin domain-containing protein [Lacinutrix neustonica]